MVPSEMKLDDRGLQAALGFDSVIPYPVHPAFGNENIKFSLFILSL